MSRFARLHPGNIDQSVRELISGQTVFVTITTGSTINKDFAIEHGLGRLPNGYVLLKGMTAIMVLSGFILYDGDTPWTTNHMYLKSSVANAPCTIAIF